MRAKRRRAILVLFVGLAITVSPAMSQAGEAALGKVVPRGGAELNQTRLVAEATVYAGDALTTPGEGGALLLLARGSSIHLGPASALAVRGGEAGVVAELNRGAVRARSQPGEKVSVWAANLLVSPESPGALYQVALTDSGVIVAAERGTVSVAGSNRTVTVPAGEAVSLEADPKPVGAGAGAGMSAGKAAAIATAITLGVTLPVAIVWADKHADDARKEGCREALTAISPGLSTTVCD